MENVHAISADHVVVQLMLMTNAQHTHLHKAGMTTVV